MSVNKEAMQQWIDVLRSGKYKQIQGMMRNEEGFCALGVGQEVVARGIPWMDAELLNQEYGVTDSQLREVFIWNDIDEKDFFEIADLLYAKYIKDPE
jgi:hypothetical protein